MSGRRGVTGLTLLALTVFDTSEAERIFCKSELHPVDSSIRGLALLEVAKLGSWSKLVHTWSKANGWCP